MKNKLKSLTKQVVGSLIPSLFILSGVPILYHISVVWMWLAIIISLPVLLLANVFVDSITYKDNKYFKGMSWINIIVQAFVVSVLVTAAHFWLASLFSISLLLTFGFYIRFRSKIKSIIKNKETK